MVARCFESLTTTTACGSSEGIVGDSASRAEAFAQISSILIQLVDEGVVTIEDDSGRTLATDRAVAVLADAENWTLPWEQHGEWHTKSDAFAVCLTDP